MIIYNCSLESQFHKQIMFKIRRKNRKHRMDYKSLYNYNGIYFNYYSLWLTRQFYNKTRENKRRNYP